MTTSPVSPETIHLTLVPSFPEHILALIERPDHFESLAGFPAAEGLRGFYVSDDVSPAWLVALRDSDGPNPWRHGFFLIHRDTGAAIGSAGFKGSPDSLGMDEIAYDRRNRDAVSARPRVSWILATLRF